MAADRPPLGRSVVLGTVAGAVFRTAAVFSLFLLFRGHNAPGGGFVGGLVAGAALVLRYVDEGAGAVARLVRFRAPTLLGLGLLLAAGTAVAPWLAGDDLLESAKRDLDLPLLGTVHLTSPLAFDAGVYLVVVGLVVGAVEHLGERAADRAAAAATEGAP